MGSGGQGKGGTPMLEGKGDIWAVADARIDDISAVVLTTNGYVKANGACVMGRGVALEARERFPGIDKEIGAFIQASGNHVCVVRGRASYFIITMPVKPAVGPNGEPGWKAMADINLIIESAIELRAAADEHDLRKTILIPRPGCGNGGLDWRDVRPVIAPILDDRFVAMHRDGLG